MCLGLCFGYQLLTIEASVLELVSSTRTLVSAIRRYGKLGTASIGQPLGKLETTNQGQHLKELGLVVELPVQRYARRSTLKA